MPQKNHPKNNVIVDCVDAINQHRANAWAVAELLTMCNAGETDYLNAKAIGYAASLIAEELEEVSLWMKRLEKEVKK